VVQPGDSLNGITEAIRKQKKIRWVQVKHEEKWNEAVAHLPEAHENNLNGFVSRIVAEIERLG